MASVLIPILVGAAGGVGIELLIPSLSTLGAVLFGISVAFQVGMVLNPPSLGLGGFATPNTLRGADELVVNTTKRQNAVPIVYGEQRVQGQLLSLQKWNTVIVNNEVHYDLNYAIGLCEGIADKVTKLFLEDVEITGQEGQQGSNDDWPVLDEGFEDINTFGGPANFWTKNEGGTGTITRSTANAHFGVASANLTTNTITDVAEFWQDFTVGVADFNYEINFVQRKNTATDANIQILVKNQTQTTWYDLNGDWVTSEAIRAETKQTDGSAGAWRWKQVTFRLNKGDFTFGDTIRIIFRCKAIAVTNNQFMDDVSITPSKPIPELWEFFPGDENQNITSFHFGSGITTPVPWRNLAYLQMHGDIGDIPRVPNTSGVVRRHDEFRSPLLTDPDSVKTSISSPHLIPASTFGISGIDRYWFMVPDGQRWGTPGTNYDGINRISADGQEWSVCIKPPSFSGNLLKYGWYFSDSDIVVMVNPTNTKEWLFTSWITGTAPDADIYNLDIFETTDQFLGWFADHVNGWIFLLLPPASGFETINAFRIIRINIFTKQTRVFQLDWSEIPTGAVQPLDSVNTTFTGLCFDADEETVYISFDDAAQDNGIINFPWTHNEGILIDQISLRQIPSLAATLGVAHHGERLYIAMREDATFTQGKIMIISTHNEQIEELLDVHWGRVNSQPDLRIQGGDFDGLFGATKFPTGITYCNITGDIVSAMMQVDPDTSGSRDWFLIKTDYDATNWSFLTTRNVTGQGDGAVRNAFWNRLGDPSPYLYDLFINDRYGMGLNSLLIDKNLLIANSGYYAEPILGGEVRAFDEEGFPSNEPHWLTRYSLNPLLEQQQPAGEHLQNLLSAISSFLIEEDGLIKIRIERAANRIVMRITEDMILDNSFSFVEDIRSERFNRIRVDFRRADDFYRTDSLFANDEFDQKKFGEIREKSFKLLHITDKFIAAKLARAFLIGSLLNRKKFQLKLPYIGLLLQVGDLVDIQHIVLGISESDIPITARIMKLDLDVESNILDLVLQEHNKAVFQFQGVPVQDPDYGADGAPSSQKAGSRDSVRIPTAWDLSFNPLTDSLVGAFWLTNSLDFTGPWTHCRVEVDWRQQGNGFVPIAVSSIKSPYKLITDTVGITSGQTTLDYATLFGVALKGDSSIPELLFSRGEIYASIVSPSLRFSPTSAENTLSSEIIRLANDDLSTTLTIQDRAAWGTTAQAWKSVRKDPLLLHLVAKGYDPLSHNAGNPIVLNVPGWPLSKAARWATIAEVQANGVDAPFIYLGPGSPNTEGFSTPRAKIENLAWRWLLIAEQKSTSISLSAPFHVLEVNIIQGAQSRKGRATKGLFDIQYNMRGNVTVGHRGITDWKKVGAVYDGTEGFTKSGFIVFSFPDSSDWEIAEFDDPRDYMSGIEFGYKRITTSSGIIGDKDGYGGTVTEDTHTSSRDYGSIKSGRTVPKRFWIRISFKNLFRVQLDPTNPIRLHESPQILTFNPFSLKSEVPVEQLGATHNVRILSVGEVLQESEVKPTLPITT